MLIDSLSIYNIEYRWQLVAKGRKICIEIPPLRIRPPPPFNYPLSIHHTSNRCCTQLYLKVLGIRGMLRLLDGRRWHGDNVLRLVGGMMRVLIRAIHPSYLRIKSRLYRRGCIACVSRTSQSVANYLSIQLNPTQLHCLSGIV